MPILETPNPDAPLTQGDVLKGVLLYTTSKKWDENGGRAETRGAQLSLVISRPCVAAHKSQVIVAAICCKKERPPKGVDSFLGIRDFLTAIRDGRSAPDRFYLGQIPGQDVGRYYAELDSLHTIGVPTDNERKLALQKYRVATLTEEFRRDLHSRLFRSFASMGFDDDAWFADQDLDWLIHNGESELSQFDAEIAKLKATAAGDAASGANQSGKSGDTTNLDVQRSDLKSELDRYKAERERRQAFHQGTTSASAGLRKKTDDVPDADRLID